LPPPVAVAAEAGEPPVRAMSDEFFLRGDEVAQLPVHATVESQEMVRTERRRWVFAIGIAVAALLVTGGVLFAHYRSSPEKHPVAAAADPPQPAPATSSQPDLAVRADAGAVAPAGVGAVAPAGVDAAPAVQVAAREPVATTHKPTQGRHKKDSPAHTAAPAASPVVTPAEFDRRYREVGRELDRLTQQKGDAAADALSKKYFAIPYSDALRSDSVRGDADRALRSLSSRIGAELEK